MHKLFWLLLFSLSFVVAKEFEITATNVDFDDNIVHSSGGVVLLHNNRYFYASSVTYDTKKQSVTLSDDVVILDDNKISIASDRAKLYLDEDRSTFVPFFFIDDDSKLWIKGKEGSHKGQLYFADTAITSSCNPNDPDWHITFSSMQYDASSQQLSMYNPVLRIKDVPVFYLPYLQVSTNRERKTGLLRPVVGVSNNDGIFYEQPIFIAPSKSWDIELNPQLRTKRSEGIYATYRFVNRPTSKGSITAGYFESKDSYIQKHDMEYSRHAGVSLKYEDSSILNRVDDGFYLHAQTVSDIDYFDLTSRNPVSASVTGDMVESKMNYFARDESFYFGSYVRFYQDTSQDSNRETLQLLPRTQLHKFSDTLLVDNILYSADLTHSNYTRRKGLKANQFELSLPVTFYTKTLGDYLHLSASQNFYMTHVDFSQDYESYEYYRNYYHFNIFTDLLKPYKKGYHNINVGANYTLPGKEKEDMEYADLAIAQQEIFDISTPAKGYSLYLKHYFYNLNKQEVFHHTLNQPYSYDSRGNRVTGEMENSFRVRPTNGVNMSLRTFYNHDERDFSHVVSGLNVDRANFDFSIRNLYSNDFDGNRGSYVTASGGYNYYSYRLFTSLERDFKENYTKKKEFGISMRKDCWDYTLTYSEDITPILTSGGREARKDQRIFFEINLIPLGGFAQSFI